MGTSPHRSEEFQTGTGRDFAKSRDPGINLFFYPGIDGIPGFFGTGLALYFYPGIFWKNLVQKPIKVFEIMVLFDMINPKKSRDYIFQNPGIRI